MIEFVLVLSNGLGFLLYLVRCLAHGLFPCFTAFSFSRYQFYSDEPICFSPVSSSKGRVVLSCTRYLTRDF